MKEYEAECDGCGDIVDKAYLKVCPHCEQTKCPTCDMGDDVECPNCDDISDPWGPEYRPPPCGN